MVATIDDTMVLTPVIQIIIPYPTISVPQTRLVAFTFGIHRTTTPYLTTTASRITIMVSISVQTVTSYTLITSLTTAKTFIPPILPTSGTPPRK